MDGTDFIVPNWRPQEEYRATWSWTWEIAWVVVASATTVMVTLAMVAALDAIGVEAPLAAMDCNP